MFVFATDKERLWKHFQKDPVLFAYHIGDLDDFFFSQCQWAASYTTRRHPVVQDVVLLYHGGETPTVLAFGVENGYAELVAETLDILPSRFFCHFQPECGEVFESRYRPKPLGTHLKMRLDNLVGIDEQRDGEIVKLDRSNLESLEQLYSKAYPGNYFTPRMLETGRYFGIKQDDRLVAVAGVHVVSDEYKIAVLGNIATDPDYRGRQLASRVTHYLAGELYHEGKLVCLNVKADNAAAIRCYERIGFVVTHRYEEALLELAGAGH
jgi:ribosomal protein S18 acetylase RimI-like enzyme